MQSAPLYARGNGLSRAVAYTVQQLSLDGALGEAVGELDGEAFCVEIEGVALESAEKSKPLSSSVRAPTRTPDVRTSNTATAITDVVATMTLIRCDIDICPLTGVKPEKVGELIVKLAKKEIKITSGSDLNVWEMV